MCKCLKWCLCCHVHLYYYITQKKRKTERKKEINEKLSTKIKTIFFFFRELGEQEVLKKAKADLLANKDETVKTMETEMSMAKLVKFSYFD